MGGSSSKQATNLPKLSEDALAQNPPFKIGEPIFDINHHMKKSHPHWEFASIEKLTSITTHTYDVAFKEDNKPKNRYTFVVPFDHTRVKLTLRDNDYINASYITGHVDKAYIATQGPLPDTFEDFWHMCWYENVRVIVMLTKTFENGRMKCHKYWPDDDETEIYGSIEISCTLTNDDTELDIIHRTLRLTHRGETRTIEHYQYHGWPDHGVPANSKALRSLLKDVQKIRDEHKTPVVVHCSAGIGRTGTYCAVDTILTKLEDHVKKNTSTPFPFKIYDTVMGLRGERTGMVQQPEQYRFLYETILDGAVELGYLKSHNDVIDAIPAQITATKSENGDEVKRKPLSKAYSMSSIPKHRLTRSGSVTSTKSDLIDETHKKMKKSKKKKKSKKDKKMKKSKSKEIKVQEEEEEESRAGELPRSTSNLSITDYPELESESTKKRSVSTSN